MDEQKFQQVLGALGVLARSNPEEMRAEQYDGSPEAALEIISADGMIEAMLNDAYDAIDAARELGATSVYFGVMNGYVPEFGKTYPAENNMELIFGSTQAKVSDGLSLEIIGTNMLFTCLGKNRVLFYYFDRGEWCNYFAEDFAPALSIIAELLSEEGYNVGHTTPAIGFWKVMSVIARLFVKNKPPIEIYENNIRIAREDGKVAEQYGAGFVVTM